MRGLLHITLTLLLVVVVAFSNSSAVLADGEDGEQETGEEDRQAAHAGAG